jgi:hypothetical protein
VYVLPVLTSTFGVLGVVTRGVVVLGVVVLGVVVLGVVVLGTDGVVVLGATGAVLTGILGLTLVAAIAGVTIPRHRTNIIVVTKTFIFSPNCRFCY